MSKPFFSEREVRLARSFINAIKGNEKNGYLLLAVIAWQRAMAKSHDAFWKTLTKYTAFRAGQLLARKLANRAALDHKGYGAILKRLRSGSGKDGGVTQARDFLLAIELSPWDRKHYGYVAYEAGHWETTTRPLPSGGSETKTTWVPEVPEYDPLAVIWAKLTGHNIPKQYFIDKVTTPTAKTVKARPPRPAQPRSLVHVLPKPEYILPYAARIFYESRPHLGANVLED